MKLAQLLSIYPQLKWGREPLSEVKGLCIDSRLFESGNVFIAIRGENFDGHSYVEQACHEGAIAVVVENPKMIPKDFTGAVVVVEDSRSAMDALASRYYGYPGDELFCVGVTGTNGKTSVVHLVAAILNRFGWSTAVMGTINHHLGDKIWESSLTTPDALEFQRRLKEFVMLGAQAVALEVSSHALMQARADSLPLNTAVFTNLSRDHLDYHGTIEEYFLSKQRLFHQVLSHSPKKMRNAVINWDDPFGRSIQVADSARTLTYGQSEADITFSIKNEDYRGSEIEVKTPRGTESVQLNMPGLHNVYNAVAAIGVGLTAGVSLKMCAEALKDFKGIRGRLELVPNNKDLFVFVDYAHTDDALKWVLTALGGVRQRKDLGNKIITVFGCGGDRDKGKRSLMGQVASELSDLVFVTSDNPRSEDPEQIIKDVMSGVPKQDCENKVFCEVNREVAIKKALQSAKAGDVVLIAGKGHEIHQWLGDRKIDFDDVEVAGRFLK